jgi:membrane protease YdiL (CAAX protease family)
MRGVSIYRNYTVSDGSPVPMLYLALAFAVFPAITEEFTFRGVILAEYESCGVGAAVFFSAFYFAMLHFDIALFPVYFAGGLILALSAYVTRSILAPIVIHTANNLFALFP